MKKKILIIGCGGYIGSYLIPHLLKKKYYEIQAFDIGFFKECNLFNNINYEKKITFKDAREIDNSDINKCDVVVHLAGISNDPLNKLTSEEVYNPTRYYTLDIAKKCKLLGKKFLFASSCSVYGASKSKGFLTETSQTNPQTGYSLNKLQIEQDLEEIADNNFSPICLRFATVFGISSKVRFDVVVNMMVGMAIIDKKIKLNSDGQAWRPNIYIEDACEAIMHFIEYERKKSKDDKLLIVNIGRNDNNLKIIDIAKIIKSLVKGTKISFLNKSIKETNDSFFRDRKIKDGKDTRTYKVSFEKSEKKFGFRCKYSVKDGIRKMIHDLSLINFNSEKFRFIGFYRLQYLEELYKKNLIDDNLKWKT